MLPKGTGKRGRPKRKIQSDSESNQSYIKKPSKKSKAASKKKLQTKKPNLTSRASKSRVQISSIQSFSDSDDESHKFIKVPLEVFNADQIFAQILNKASKQPQYLMMLRNLLSGSSRLKQDKVNQFKKKWKTLKNSNCSQEQYFSRQSQLKRSQNQQLAEIEEDIFTKLAISNIRGFETKEGIIAQYQIKHPRDINAVSMEQGPEYIIENHTWNKYRQQQRKLLQMLMKQADLVSQDYKLINVTHSYSSQPNNSHIHNPMHSHTANKQEETEMDLKFNNLQTQQNPQATQFLFSKHFSQNVIDYERVFDTGFKITQQQKYYVDNKAMSWLLQSKCDQIYTNERFQKQTYEKYTEILKDIYQDDSKYSDKDIMDKILQSAAYVLNSVHYYQKFKLKCELLHPLDLLLVVQKLSERKKQRQRKIQYNFCKKNANTPAMDSSQKMYQQKQVGEIMNCEEQL